MVFHNEFLVPSNGLVRFPATFRRLPYEVSEPQLTQRASYDRPERDHFWELLARYDLYRIQLDLSMIYNLKSTAEDQGVDIESFRLLSSFAANFYMFEYIMHASGASFDEEFVAELAGNTNMIELLVRSDHELSLEQMGLIASVAQYNTVEFLDPIFRVYLTMATLGEARHHPFIDQAIFGNEPVYDPLECGTDRREKRCYGCDCEYCMVLEEYGEIPENSAAAPACAREAGWVAALDWAVAQPAELHDLLAEIFLEFNSSASYGGHLWAASSQVVAQRLRGELGPTEHTNKKLFVDRAFSLEHNGGCIFNKIYSTFNMGSVLEAHHQHSVHKLRLHSSGVVAKRLGDILHLL